MSREENTRDEDGGDGVSMSIEEIDYNFLVNYPFKYWTQYHVILYIQ